MGILTSVLSVEHGMETTKILVRYFRGVIHCRFKPPDPLWRVLGDQTNIKQTIMSKQMNIVNQQTIIQLDTYD